MRQILRLPFLTRIALLAALCLLSAGLLVLRWQFATPLRAHLDLGNPSVSVSHFYDVEKSEGVGFRWSRALSAVSLPALAASQVITVTANPARPAQAAPATFRLLVGTQTIGEFKTELGWQAYTATVSAQLSPDIRLLIESDTFYPSQSDRRRLGLAISEISTASSPGALGLTWPPLPWLVCALFGPVLGALGGRALWKRGALIAGALFVFVPISVAVLLPSTAALPALTWAIGLASLALLLYYARQWLDDSSWWSAQLTRLAHSRWELPALALLIGTLSLVFTWPLVQSLGDSLPGWPGDNFAFLYKFWWFRTALFDRRQWPLFDPNTFAPFGFNLGQGEPTLANTLPGVFIGALFNDVIAYNILALSSFVISGLGAYLLVREITGNRSAALLAAIAFAFCPYRMSQFAGHIQLLGTGWIALAFYFVERAFKTRRWLDGGLAGVSLALAALSAWYYAYMVGLLLALYIIARLWAERHTVRAISLWRPALAGLVAFALLAGPVALPSLSLAREGQLSHSAKAADEHSAAPADYVIPNELHPLWGEGGMRAHADQNVIESALYLGVVVVAITLGGWMLGRRKDARPNAPVGARPARAWLLLLIVSFVLSLGLRLHDTGGQVSITLGGNSMSVPLPGQVLYDWLPLFSSMRAYSRFGLLVILALVVLMGMGWTHIVMRWPTRGNWLTLLALAALLADFWTAPYAWGTSRVEASQTSQYLASAPSGTIMQVPLTSALSGPALFAETYYGKPIAYGYDTFEPAQWRAARPALEKFPSDAALDVLRRWGVRYVVVSANAYGADWEGTLGFLRSLPRLKYLEQFHERRVWDVDPDVLDARPDAEDYLTPDTLAVFELLR